MRFTTKISYNLDLLNVVNVMTGDEFYIRFHPEVYKLFKDRLSAEARNSLKSALELHKSAMFGPFLSLVVSSVPGFETLTMSELLVNFATLHEHFSQTIYYDGDEWPAGQAMLQKLAVVVAELELAGFREYWEREKRELIVMKKAELDRVATKYDLESNIQNMLGPGQSFEEITVYLCSFASPHGMKIVGPRYITDIAYPHERTLSIAIHEMFHPPYNAKILAEELTDLGNDPLLQHAFQTKNPKYGYLSMRGFIEENVVEAMQLHICEKIGLEKDPYGYLVKHDDGSHMLSFVLLEYFKRYPKEGDISFEKYFGELLKVMPVGALDKEYRAICTRYNLTCK